MRGSLEVPPDKSISHRYALLSALAHGETTIERYSTGADCLSTLACLEALGAEVRRLPEDGGLTVRIQGRAGTLAAPAAPLDCGNSGTTMRMLAGILAAQPFAATLVGDASLSRRPMRRVMTPLAQMGARLEAADGGRPPLRVHGGRLTPITYAPEVPSAQVKSAVLFAGLGADGVTTVVEPAATRDHTERALEAFGVRIERAQPGHLAVRGVARLISPGTLRVPGDPSSCAFLAVAAAGLPGSAVELRNVGLNPTRSALFDVLRRAGADVTTTITGVRHGEPVGVVRVAHGDARPLAIAETEVPLLIDELPALAALATFGGRIEVRGAAELRVKESDRISSLVGGLRALGADADELPDGFVIRGGARLSGGEVDAGHDHRLAMSFAVAALGAAADTTIHGAEIAAVSFPGFFETLDRLRA